MLLQLLFLGLFLSYFSVEAHYFSHSKLQTRHQYGCHNLDYIKPLLSSENPLIIFDDYWPWPYKPEPSHISQYAYPPLTIEYETFSWHHDEKEKPGNEKPDDGNSPPYEEPETPHTPPVLYPDAATDDPLLKKDVATMTQNLYYCYSHCPDSHNSKCTYSCDMHEYCMRSCRFMLHENDQKDEYCEKFCSRARTWKKSEDSGNTNAPSNSNGGSNTPESQTPDTTNPSSPAESNEGNHEESTTPPSKDDEEESEAPKGDSSQENEGSNVEQDTSEEPSTPSTTTDTSTGSSTDTNESPSSLNTPDDDKTSQPNESDSSTQKRDAGDNLDPDVKTYNPSTREEPDSEDPSPVPTNDHSMEKESGAHVGSVGFTVHQSGFLAAAVCIMSIGMLLQ